MLDRYRPNQPTAQEDAVRAARMTVEHQQATARFHAAERRRKAIAILLLVLACGGGIGFFVQQRLSAPALTRVPAGAGKTPASKDLINRAAVREAVFQALQSRGIGARQGERAILTDGDQRREIDLRPPEKRREPPPK